MVTRRRVTTRSRQIPSDVGEGAALEGVGRGRGRERRPPVRNGMVANLALDLLDLPPVEGSEFDVAMDLRLTSPN